MASNGAGRLATAAVRPLRTILPSRTACQYCQHQSYATQPVRALHTSRSSRAEDSEKSLELNSLADQLQAAVSRRPRSYRNMPPPKMAAKEVETTEDQSLPANSSIQELLKSLAEPNIRREGGKLRGKIPPLDLTPPNLRLGAHIGRTARIEAGSGDVGRAFTKLYSIVGSNQVKREWQKQRFHQRPGIKRKTLARKRWRANFKEGHQALISRAMELKRMGW